MKTFFREHIWETILVFVLIAFIGLITWMCVSSIQQEKEFNNWYASLSAEEKAEYNAEQARKREANIYRYEVVGVSKYVKTETNHFGAVTDTDICYEFQYISGNSLKHVSDFEHLEYGLTKVIIGDKDMYIVDKNSIDTYRYLQLTKETLASLKTAN